ncbi:hypothetical protein DB30_04966 [Enhygromyxa salina]|uniref:Uncharacterized protein n=1 Tax=Enhygromyxa salina TaxID=215803 RepID=A0A0C1ZEJ4_9BACT|nr:hypothetical protein DB30_04966 [Enhygromyxa salina]
MGRIVGGSSGAARADCKPAPAKPPTSKHNPAPRIDEVRIQAV